MAGYTYEESEYKVKRSTYIHALFKVHKKNKIWYKNLCLMQNPFYRIPKCKFNVFAFILIKAFYCHIFCCCNWKEKVFWDELGRKCSFNPIRHELFLGCSRMEGAKSFPLPKICHTYPTMMKLGTVIPYLKKIQKIYESRDTPLEFCWHQHFFTGNQQILLYQEIQI